MKFCRVLPLLFTTLLFLAACSDDAAVGTAPSATDTASPDDGSEVSDLPAEDSDVVDVTGADRSDLDLAVDTGVPVSEYHFVGSIVVAAGIHHDEERDFTIYGTLACLSGCSAQMQNESGDFNIVSFGGGYR